MQPTCVGLYITAFYWAICQCVKKSNKVIFTCPLNVIKKLKISRL